MQKEQNLQNAETQALNIPVVSKRFKIDGKSITTGSMKTFYFYNEDEWNAFYKKKQFTHYPAWVFFYESIAEW